MEITLDVDVVDNEQPLKSSEVFMSSVSPGGSSGSSSSSEKGFIISPSSLKDEDELMIIENFYQIQLGGMKKIGIIGTQELSENHQQMIELVEQFE